jgi:predicted phage-related endonuclease
MTTATLVANIDRRRYIGGSDAAAIMGLDPYGRTATSVYLAKREESPPVDKEHPDYKERQKFFARRKAQEPIIAGMLFDEYGVQVTRLSIDENPNRYLDPEHGFIAAEIDFEFAMTQAVRDHFPERPDFGGIPDGTIVNGEIKTVHPFLAHAWGEIGTEEVPAHYAAQVMHGLMVTGRPAALVVALIGIDSLLAFPVMRDDETIDGMRAMEVTLWNDHILKGIPPPPKNLNDIKLIFTNYVGRPVEVDDEIVRLLERKDAIPKLISDLDKEKEDLEFRIASYVCRQWGYPPPVVDFPEENAILMHNGVEVGSWKKQTSYWLDQKQLKADSPEITAKYTKTTDYRILRRKKPKKEKGA